MLREKDIVALLFFFASTTAAAQVRWTVAPHSRLWLEGDSTLHRYRADAARFEVELATDDAELAMTPAALAPRRLDVEVPVKELHSGESGLDQNLVHALHGDAHPTISFELARAEAKPIDADGTMPLVLHGRLTVAGTTRDADVVATAKSSPEGLHFVGVVTLSMHAFGVEPPVLMFGAIRTSDRVDVHFDLQFQRVP